jgi:hypothetical protein
VKSGWRYIRQEQWQAGAPASGRRGRRYSSRRTRRCTRNQAAALHIIDYSKAEKSKWRDEERGEGAGGGEARRGGEPGYDPGSFARTHRPLAAD